MEWCFFKTLKIRIFLKWPASSVKELLVFNNFGMFRNLCNSDNIAFVLLKLLRFHRCLSCFVPVHLASRVKTSLKHVPAQTKPKVINWKQVTLTDHKSGLIKHWYPQEIRAWYSLINIFHALCDVLDSKSLVFEFLQKTQSEKSVDDNQHHWNAFFL